MPRRKRPSADRVRSRVSRITDRSEPFPVDIEDHSKEFLVSAELPGLQKQALDISVRKDTLQIVADFGEDADGTYHQKERGRGAVRRVIHLPEPIDEKHVSASYDNGVLWITLQKRDQPKRVDIQ